MRTQAQRASPAALNKLLGGNTVRHHLYRKSQDSPDSLPWEPEPYRHLQRELLRFLAEKRSRKTGLKLCLSTAKGTFLCSSLESIRWAPPLRMIITSEWVRFPPLANFFSFFLTFYQVLYRRYPVVNLLSFFPTLNQVPYCIFSLSSLK